jgi:hypothetical protein
MLVFLLTTVLRSVRDDFSREIWHGLGVEAEPGDFFASESIVGVAILFLSGLMVCVRDNRLAFFGALAMSMAGLVVIGVALVGLRAGALSPMGFMVLQGMGVYLPYVVFHTTVFERLIALTRDRGTIVYLMGLADAVGYLGYSAVMMVKNSVGTLDNFLAFFVPLSWTIAGIGVLLLIPCWRYFALHAATQAQADMEPVQA